MIKRFLGPIPWLFVGGILALPLRGELLVPETTAKPTNTFHVTPGPMDGRIAFLTAKMLEQLHYSRQPFDDKVSSKFLDRYLETLDPQHLHFLQSDLADFERYRANLDHLTVTRRGVGDTTPACEIFNRYLQRLQQRVAYVDDLLKHEKFEFNTDDRISVNRKDAPYPRDLADAEKLWRERLRFEYLQERLGKIDARKKADTAAAKAAAGEKNEAGDTTGPAAKKTKTEAEEIVDTLTHRYQRNLRTFADWDNDDVLQLYLTALAHVYDPHSDYFGHAQLDAFSIGMNLSLFGIGAELVSEDGYCTIRRLLPGGPAEKSKKIKEKDRILAVAQSNGPPVDVVDMSLNKAVQLIRGPKGTEVRLTMLREGADRSASTVITLIRDEIKLEDQEAKAKVIDLPDASGQTARLGVIDLPSFYATFDPSNTRSKAEPKSTTTDVSRLVAKLKKENVQGIILDLRRNGGGSLEEAIRLTGLFIKQGPVVQVRDTDGAVQIDEDPDPSQLYDGPLVVLTSRFSASASEIVAGALQDYGRALVVGDASTHGKGTVQSVNPLRPHMHWPDSMMTNDPGALKLTIKKFYRASGASTQLRGVTPDIILPSVANASKDIGESALENPMPWDTIASAKYEALNRVEPYLTQLRERSEARIAKDQEFAYLLEDIQQFKKLQADKTVSLNEHKRLQEKEEAEARQKARDKERLARKEPPEKVYELTLRQVDLPGLPAPVAKTNAALARLSGSPGSGAAGAVGTNTASINVPPVPKADLEDDADEEKPTPVDVSLVEAEHILVDYLSLLPKANVVTTGR